jgi:hypothetical protein
MDRRLNPYAPGAGTTPPYLIGRADIIENAAIALDRIRAGRSARSIMLVGLRGVGKTVLLNHIADNADTRGFGVVSIETPEGSSLPGVLVPAVRTLLLKFSKLSKAGDLTARAMRVLGGFLQAAKVKFGDLELSFDLGTEPGIADSGDLEHDLTALFVELGRVAQERETAFTLCIDELQYIKEDQFAALITALHKCSQKALPITVVGAGLPHLIGQAGKAKSYAERLFEFREVGALGRQDSYAALSVPSEKEGISFSANALEKIFSVTRGYPYFLQEWGKHCWDEAESSPITIADVEHATKLAISELDRSFFRVRFDRLTPSEKLYLRAMAEFGNDASSSGRIASILGKEVQGVAPTRARLIKKGMIYSSARGENSFTVPLFDSYMKRIIPKLEV